MIREVKKVLPASVQRMAHFLLKGALLLVFLATSAVQGQEFAPYRNLEGKVLCIDSIATRFSIEAREGTLPAGFVKEDVAQQLWNQLKAGLRGIGVPFSERFTCAYAEDKDIGLYFLILPIQLGEAVRGYAIQGRIVISDWTTSYPYPVEIWETAAMRVTSSTTTSALRQDLMEMAMNLLTDLIVDWLRANPPRR